MKFAKELEEDLVPEWRVKYFNYKIGKKKIKAVSRALRAASKTPQTPGRPALETARSGDQLPYTRYDFNRNKPQAPTPKASQPENGKTQTTQKGVARNPAELDRRFSLTMFATSPGLTPQDSSGEQADVAGYDDDDDDSDASSDSDHPRNEDERPLQKSTTQSSTKGQQRYGSIVSSPPSGKATDSLSALELPDPALDPSKQNLATNQSRSNADLALLSPQASKISRAPTDAPKYWEQGGQKRKLSSLPKELLKRAAAKGDKAAKSQLKFRKTFNTLNLDSPGVTTSQFEAYRDLDTKQGEFFAFLDKELDKVEKFYQTKEDEAAARLRVLREQLHEMRDRRLEDLETAKKGGKIADEGLFDGQIPIMSTPFQNGISAPNGVFKPVTDIFHRNSKIGKTSEARQELSTPRGSYRGKPPNQNQAASNDRGDYVRKQQGHEKVPYRYAKRKLRLALQEFYRGLELLKSYALLNRTAFRKINKKYDKAVMARPPLRYMSEKVNTSHFVQSTFIEETLVGIEDLYSRYFERGNRKVAVSKLRSNMRTGDQSSVAFRNGLYIAAGLGFGVTGIIDGSKYLFSDDIVTKTEASYLFQMYGGYFLAVLLFLFFVIDCRIWTKNRINYTFVFEYDTRHTLDWRQLAELPCFFLFLNGLFFWLNFQFHVEHAMYRLWPVVMIAVTVIIIFLPFKILYYHGRKWFLFSNWRLLLAGLYPVEFRDFFLGDMYCSETYTMSQIEVFFCIYVNNWDDPSRCASGKSRLLGFLTTLPAIWRALQCLRRYYDSRKWFPHLANFAKYCCNILYYMSLSMYRIHLTAQMKSVFIVFAVLNGLYCSFWDVFMDFSLGNPWSKNFLLRDNLGFRKKWIYYCLIVFDVTLRQQWILYVIFTTDTQHATVMSFMVGMAEVFRRGVWSLFRVENEHCNNVQQFRASRDIPLPYSVPGSPETNGKRKSMQEQPSANPKQSDKNTTKPQYTTGASPYDGGDIEQTATNASTIRSRRGPNSQTTPGISALQRVSTVIAAAHAHDFQKKRHPSLGPSSPQESDMIGHRLQASSDEDTDDESRRGSGEALRQLDSRQNDIRQARSDEHEQQEIEDQGNTSGSSNVSPGGSIGASGSGTRRISTRPRMSTDGRPSDIGVPRTSSNERNSSTMREAEEMNDADVAEVRDRIERARH